MLTLLLALLTTAEAHDHSKWQAVLDKHRAAEATVDYPAIQAASSTKSYVTGLATASEPTQRAEKLAFWLNAYNAITVDLVAKSWPIGSIKELDSGKVWTTRSFTVAGQRLSLDQIEKEKLVPLGEPRIHFALNCASRGCPPLSAQAFTPEHLEVQLGSLTQTWLSSRGISIGRDASKLTLSSIFDWYSKDFPADGTGAIPGTDSRLLGVLQFVARHLPEADAQWIRAGGYSIRFEPFNWSVNSR